MKKNKFLLALILLSLLSYWRWFSNFGILTNGDWGYFLPETQKELAIISTWTSKQLFGFPNLDLSMYPTNFLWGLLANFIDFALSERILYFWPSIIIAVISSYFLVKSLKYSSIAAFIGAIIYTFNTYFIVGRTGHLTLMVAFSIAPLIILLFKRSLEKRKYSLLIPTVIISFIASFYEFRVFYIVAFVLFLYFFYYLLILEKLKKQEVKKVFIFFFSFFLIIFFLNFYWIIALQEVNILNNNALFSRGLFGNAYMNIFQAMTLFHPFWTGSTPAIFVVQPIPFYFWFIPLFAFLGFWLGRKNKQVLFFGFVALLGILLSKQVDEPFPKLYQWLYDNLPGFNAFREASKFYFLIALGYSVLIGSFVDWLWKNWKEGQLKIAGKYFLTVFIAGLFLWNTKPVITGEIGTLFTPRNIPEDYLTLKDFILKQPQYFRTLWTPRDSRWGIYTNNHPKISNVDVVQKDWKNFNTFVATGNNWPMEKQILEVLKHPYSNSLLDASSIRYVIVPLQDTANDDDFFVHYGGKTNPEIRDWYISELEKLEYLQKVDIGTDEVAVYENKNHKPHIFTLDNLYSINSMGNLDDKYDFITGKLGGKFDFVLGGDNQNHNLTIAKSIFENVDESNINQEQNGLFDSIENINGLGKNVLYEKKKIDGKDVFEEREIPTDKEDKALLTYTDSNYQFVNAIPNASFEQGSWQKEVGDCNRYDDYGILKMGLNSNEKTDGEKSLQLEATRHIACSSIDVEVKENAEYLFKFDYQSPNSKVAGYYLGFNDPEKTVMKEQIPVADNLWHTFTKQIRVPRGTTKISVVLYAYASDNKDNNVVRYDNFKMISLPKLDGRFYFVSKPKTEIGKPQGITIKEISPTKKTVHVRFAGKPFYLAMSEAWHPQWQLEMDNEKVHGFFDSWSPFAKPDKISDSLHYKLDNSLNAWFVDVNDLCKSKNMCEQNPDGTYDIFMVIEFWPQRWMFLGLVISGATLVGCISYLIYFWRKKRKQKYVNYKTDKFVSSGIRFY